MTHPCAELCSHFELWKNWPVDAAAIVENARDQARSLERSLLGVFHNRLENATRVSHSVHRPLSLATNNQKNGILAEGGLP